MLEKIVRGFVAGLVALSIFALIASADGHVSSIEDIIGISISLMIFLLVYLTTNLVAIIKTVRPGCVVSLFGFSFVGVFAIIFGEITTTVFVGMLLVAIVGYAVGIAYAKQFRSIENYLFGKK